MASAWWMPVSSRSTLTPALAAILGPDIHPLDLGVVRAKNLDAAAARGLPGLPDDKESHARFQQLVHAVAVAAGLGIQRVQVRFQLGYELLGIGRVGALGGDNKFHRGIAFDQPSRSSSSQA